MRNKPKLLLNNIYLLSMGIVVSNQGLLIVEKERIKKKWSRSQKAWYDQANVSESTLKRFLSRKPIGQQAFVSICQAVGISEWEEIVDWEKINISVSTKKPTPLEVDTISVPTSLSLPSQPVEVPIAARVEILYPVQKSIIDRNVEVSAITENIGEDQQKWLIVYAPGAKKWYPNEVKEQESQWKTSIIVGSVNCYGSQFKILLFITNNEGSDYLRSFPDGTSKLPPGFSVEIIVQRSYTPPKETIWIL